MIPPLTAESEELKSLLMKVKEESDKVGLKFNIQKIKIMASSPITSWQIDGETVADFMFLGFKITADGDCSHEIKRRLLIGRKFMTNLDSILKSRDITLPTKVHLVKAMVFPVVMYGCESWTIKKVGLGVQNEAGQRLIEFLQENSLFIANTLFQQHKRRLYTWTSAYGQYRN